MEQERLSIVAVHQEGGTKISNGLQIKLNTGKLLTEELIVVLLEESLKMGAERFIIEDKRAIVGNLVRKADELWQKDKS